MVKLTTNAVEKSPSKARRMRMHWGEAKIQFCSMFKPSGHELIRHKAVQLQISRSDLIEYLSRSLENPAVVEAVIKQMKA